MTTPVRLRSQLFEVPTGVVDATDQMEFDKPEAIDAAARYIKSNLASSLVSGDVVQFLDVEGGYRNSGKVVYYKGDVVNFADDVDEYGALPKCVTINQFGVADYFRDAITHNTVIWHDWATYPAVSQSVFRSGGWSVPTRGPVQITPPGDFRIIYFKDGWTLLTDYPSNDIVYAGYEYETEATVMPTHMPPGIDTSRMMYYVSDDNHPEIE